MEASGGLIVTGTNVKAIGDRIKQISLPNYFVAARRLFTG
jgi:hypothetical protein